MTEIEDSDDESEDLYEGFDELKDSLIKRCEAAQIKCDEVEEPDGGRSLRIYMPCGRDTVPILFGTSDRLRRFLETDFEHYTFLGDYEAICNYEKGTIEAAIRPLGPLGGPSFVLYRRLFGVQFDTNELDESELTLDVKADDGPQMSISMATDVFQDIILPFGRRSRLLSLKISNLSVHRHDDAVALMEQISDPLFFQIDLTRDIALSLQRRRRPRFRRAKGSSLGGAPELEFPRTEFDKAPISLYWYARSASGMPLLQFLAYYQTIEYYFPTYSIAEAKRQLGNILKSPEFRFERDADLGKVLAITRGLGYWDERSQLRATLHECLDPRDLYNYLTEFPERKDFFSKKVKGLTDQKLSLGNPEADLKTEVANRIYDIRCKIVHSKESGKEGDREVLLPFSKAAELMNYDIDLIQYLARRVLIAASIPLRI